MLTQATRSARPVIGDAAKQAKPVGVGEAVSDLPTGDKGGKPENDYSLYNGYREWIGDLNKINFKEKGYALHQMSCCGIGEALINYNKDYHRKGMEAVKHCIASALYFRKSYLVWSVVLDLSVYDEVIKVLNTLPNTVNMGDSVNSNSGSTIRVYVTDLKKEWK